MLFLTLSCRGIGVSKKSNEKMRSDLKNYFTALSLNNDENERAINQQNKRFILFSLNVAKDIYDSKPFDVLSLVSGSKK